MQPNPFTNRPQFSLFGMLSLVTLFCVVFALLAALGSPPLQTLLGFLLFGGIAGVGAVVIELFAQLTGMRKVP